MGRLRPAQVPGGKAAAMHDLTAGFDDANPAARVYLEPTWARPDMAEADAPKRPAIAGLDGRPTGTGRDPPTLGSGEQAAIDPGIDATTARALQRVASEQLGFSPGKPPGSAPAR
ncbi:hypothetical protein [Roseateles saccharophilus]|uniref:Uncharacterized protein n=1 Tax=Roseateles saccharophilus TaxID=304 RepID=A0A4R3V1A5_ROSSA|nr:hypothetical protein [Roseateles saccharophilus]MDG0832309.1 hypothetical protein [Roseateles saccharophilus]TCU97003.1 hypothetical protein EV671_101214 [Roseateles saccharophilus]